MFIWIKNHKTEVYIFLLGFGLRFLYALFVQFYFGSHGFIAYSDAYSFYLRGAENIVNHHIFSMNAAPPYMPDAYRTPLYTFFVAFFVWLKMPFFAIIFVQNILAGFMGVFIYRLGIMLFNSKKIGLFAAILMSIEPMSIYWNNLMMSDYLFAFFFIFAFYEFAAGRHYLFGLFLGLATLTRPISLYFFPLFLLMMIWKNFSWRKIIVTILIFSAVIFPWMFRNKIVFNTWDLSSASWYNLYRVVTGSFSRKENFELPLPVLPSGYANPELFHYDFHNVPFYQANFWKIFKKRPISYLKFHTSLIFTSFFKNPYEYLTIYVLKPKLPYLFHGFAGRFIVFSAWAGWAVWMLIYVLAILSFFAKESRNWLYLVFFIILFNTLSLGALGLGADMSRYNLAIAPLIFLFAGVGVRFIYNRFKYIM